ncbi:MAG: hypothetical protein OXI16_05745 [Chloroflexota bacterium]|nr:hypothetical protein [Chloroflexota bacterium]
MARRRFGHDVTRPGREHGDEDVVIPVAKDLEKAPDSLRREQEITFYAREYPLESFALEQSASVEWADDIRREVSPETQELYEEFQDDMMSEIKWVRSSGDLEPTAEPDGQDVTDSIREKARALGYSEVGFTRFDRRYIYKARLDDVRRGLPNAICLALEQEHSATQTLPSIQAEEAQGETYRRQATLVKDLVAHINALGYRAQVSGPTWQFGPMIPMFVDAGLGQLGVNGQLLSPHFGSRARLQIIITDARVTHDRPVDYGVPKFCEICQVCFMRCPGRAIQGQRLWYRGVEKAKLIAKRCRPVMTRYSGCGVCMKTCPIQKYGMKPVMEHYIETGDVLGKGTENLEGYELPDKGYFEVGKLPRFDTEFFNMPTGRAEDYLMENLQDSLKSADNVEDEELAWREYRDGLETTLNRQTAVVDMGMDLGVWER